MNALEVIGHKRDGREHSPDEIRFLITGYVQGAIPDYQIAAWLMAVCIRGMVPADKLLYALRDVTATVPSVPLIASSVMSKKIAAGADAIVLDVKFGRGAFMPDVSSAEELASEMVQLGEGEGRRTVALVTAMDNPLGVTVGNALEVQEALDALSGKGDEELLEACVRVTREMCALAGVKAHGAEGPRSGAGRQKFEQMLSAPGRPLERRLPTTAVQSEVAADQ